MTNRQAKICKIIRKHKQLDIILKKCKIADYQSLLYCFPNGAIDIEWGEQEKDENSTVQLSDSLLAELEERERRAVDNIFTRSIAIAALVISILALLSEIGILKLPQYSSAPKLQRSSTTVTVVFTETSSSQSLKGQPRLKSGLQYE